MFLYYSLHYLIFFKWPRITGERYAVFLEMSIHYHFLSLENHQRKSCLEIRLRCFSHAMRQFSSACCSASGRPPWCSVICRTTGFRAGRGDSEHQNGFSKLYPMFPILSLKLPLQPGHNQSQELNSQLMAPCVAKIRSVVALCWALYSWNRPMF